MQKPTQNINSVQMSAFAQSQSLNYMKINSHDAVCLEDFAPTFDEWARMRPKHKLPKRVHRASYHPLLLGCGGPLARGVTLVAGSSASSHHIL